MLSVIAFNVMLIANIVIANSKYDLVSIPPALLHSIQHQLKVFEKTLHNSLTSINNLNLHPPYLLCWKSYFSDSRLVKVTR